MFIADDIFKAFTKAGTPTRPLERPGQQRLGFAIGCSPDFRHPCDAMLANCHPSQPFWNMSRGFRSEGVCEEGQPFLDRRRFIVANVVNPRVLGLNGGKGCRCSVVYVDKGPAARSFSNDRNAPPLYFFDERTSFSERCSGAIETAVAQNKSFNRLIVSHGLDVANGFERLADSGLWGRYQRVLFRIDPHSGASI